MKGRIWCDAIASDSAIATAVRLDTHSTGAKLRFHASTEAARTNPHTTAAEAVAGSTLNRRVSSQSMGARISADVHAYVVPTSQSPAFTRDAHASHPSAYTIAAAATAVFGSELDSATARSR